MLFARLAITIAVFTLAATVRPCLAQTVTASPPTGLADAWTVSPDAARGLVQISKTATDGSTLFRGGCNKLAGAGFTGSFLRYRGGGLRMDGENERVLLYVSGEGWKEAFAAQLRYVASSGAWEIVGVLAPVFVNSFSRGGRLAVFNSRHREVFSFDLTGSSAAARTMREVCGFGTGLPGD